MRYLLILLLVLIVYALVDCVRHDNTTMPGGVPKAVWVVLIVVFPGAGAIAWLLVSRLTRQAQSATRPARPSYGGYPSRPAPRRPVTRPVAPDDDLEFLASLDRQLPDPEPEREPDEQGPAEGGGAEDDADDPTAGGSGSSSDEDNGPGPRR